MLLTLEEAKKAIYVDPDFDDDIIRGYIESASSFLEEKTGFDFSKVTDPMAKDFCRMFIKDRHFNSNGSYNREHDYSLGIDALLIQLQFKARKYIEEENKNEQSI